MKSESSIESDRGERFKKILEEVESRLNDPKNKDMYMSLVQGEWKESEEEEDILSTLTDEEIKELRMKGFHGLR